MIAGKRYNLLVGMQVCILWALSSCVSTPHEEIEVTHAPPVDSNIIIVAKNGGQFATIGEAAAAARAGQIIKIRGGVYHETITVSTPRLAFEAFDPSAEPVIIDGADQNLFNMTHQWEKVKENVWRIDYEPPFSLLSDDAYTRQNGNDPLLQVYENEVLLRGYRDPFVARRIMGKTLKRLYGETYGLAGAYVSVDELDAADTARLDLGEDVKPDTRIPGRFLYDTLEKKLYISPAASGGPETRRYAVPILDSLFVLKADNIRLKNLILTHSAGYAVRLEGADAGSIEGCVFRNTHFAVSVTGTNDFSFRSNVVEESGFWERYSLRDIAGTRYQAKAVTVEPFTADGRVYIEDNVFRGSAFYIEPNPGRLIVSGNIIAYSVFGLFGPGSVDADESPADFTLQIKNNIVHHLDKGIAIPARWNGRINVFVYRNCFYGPFQSAPTGQEETIAGPCTIYCYNNTLAIAGNVRQQSFSNPFGEHTLFFNNLCFAKNTQHAIFVDTGEGTPWPVVAGPLLGHNLFCGPPDQDGVLKSFKMQGETFLYRKARNTVNTGTVDNSAAVFAHRQPLESTAYYHGTFDPPGIADISLVFKNGTNQYFENYRARLLLVFALSEKSPARNAGRLLPEGLPDSNTLSDGKPDIGALEY